MELHEGKGAQVWTWNHRNRGHANQAKLRHLAVRKHHSTFGLSFKCFSWISLPHVSLALILLALLINLFHYSNIDKTETDYARYS